MDPKVVDDLALRLLSLQQRFESYCALHDEELAEIKETLRQLRGEILNDSKRGLPMEWEAGKSATPDDDASDVGVAKNRPALSV